MGAINDLVIKVRVDSSAALRSLAGLQRAVDMLNAIYRGRAEILLSAALLGGWSLVTWGLALLTTSKVWPISGGLLLLSCGGWRMLWRIVSDGLYALTRQPRG